MSKQDHNFIIHNRSSRVSDVEALELVRQVVEGGKVSNNGTQYCYATVCRTAAGDVAVCCDKNKRSFRFIVMDDERKKDDSESG